MWKGGVLLNREVKVVIGYGRSEEDRTAIKSLLREFENKRRDVRFILASNKEEALQEIGDAHVYFGFRFGPELLEKAHELLWVHFSSAGVNHALYPALLKSPLLLSSSKGLHPPYISEHILAGIFYFYADFDHIVALQKQKKWDKTGIVREKRLLQGKQVLILGLGHIGKAAAQRLCHLGAVVHGIKKHVDETYADGVTIHSMEELFKLLPQADIVIDILPLTDETRGLMGKDFFKSMRDSALFINVGRGEHVVEEALLAEAPRFRGIVLDATSREPLTEDSPLWDLPNILLTQHTSGDFADYTEKATLFFLENLERFLDGEEPEGLIDKNEGY